MVNSVLSAGLQGVQNGIGRANEAAQDIARATTADVFNPEQAAVDVTAPRNDDRGGGIEAISEAAVELKVSEIQVKASAAVVRTADEVLGTLINTKA